MNEIELRLYIIYVCKSLTERTSKANIDSFKKTEILEKLEILMQSANKLN